MTQGPSGYVYSAVSTSGEETIDGVSAPTFPTTHAGTAVNGGGTFVVTVPIPLNSAVELRARILMTHRTALGVLDAVGDLNADCVVERSTGAPGFTSPTALSANPVSGGAANFPPQVAGTPFHSGGGSPPSAVWSTSGNNALLTVTNPGTVDASVHVYLERLTF